MNKRGFTLVELLATLVVLGIVTTIVVVSVTGSFGGAKAKTEGLFIETIKDAMSMYLDSDAKNLTYEASPVCTINKSFGVRKLYKTTSVNLNFSAVINSEYKPITQKDLVNPAQKEVTCALAANIPISIYRDEDYVYYYKIEKSVFLCLTESGSITNLPSECVNK